MVEVVKSDGANLLMDKKIFLLQLHSPTHSTAYAYSYKNENFVNCNIMTVHNLTPYTYYTMCNKT